MSASIFSTDLLNPPFSSYLEILNRKTAWIGDLYRGPVKLLAFREKAQTF